MKWISQSQEPGKTNSTEPQSIETDLTEPGPTETDLTDPKPNEPDLAERHIASKRVISHSVKAR